MNGLENELRRLACACRILEMEGHGDMSLGHVSLRDPDGRGFWLKRNRIGLGEVVGLEDFVLVDFDGNKLAGGGGRHSEWPIHSEILLRRSDINVVAHTHPLYACIVSASSEPLQPYTIDGDYFVEVPRHPDEVALITTKDEGAALAKTLGQNFAVFMANHGVTFCGTSIEHATCLGIFLEKASRMQTIARSAQFKLTVPSDAVRARRHAQIMTPIHIEHSWNFFTRKLEWWQATRAQGQARIYG